ncbi:metal ABC transporter ATP-binding protein [Laspinema sp. D1]|uniref:Metal ABC transporter ATP-binding protein n=1 Tax=Laspinema palackyanum D2a TaxID=2953684 RepID=A0ABT2MTR4_9CYAN|nr:metal ABC transporter ATP-binding protein [Laspinema sp. D2a]
MRMGEAWDGNRRDLDAAFTRDYSIVKIENLSVYRGSYTALRDVSFELKSGTNVAVVGPNGAGKSTLVQAILGLIPRSSGRVEIMGRPLEKLGRLRSHLGYIPQTFLFDRTFPISVGEVVGLGWQQREPFSLSRIQRFPWQSNPEKETAVMSALRRVDALHLRHRAVGVLSGGQLKRVLLAYCLVMSRQLLILDEALAGVDVQGEADFYTLLNELKTEQNWTVLQVSHDLNMVSRHCDRVICLNQTLVCSGAPDIALAPQNLLATYGPAFAHYHHDH